MGTSETSYFNKNIEDFLLLKTQPNENLISSHNFPKNEKKEYFNDNAPNIYKEISAKMCVFKGKKGQDLENTITYMLKQYDRNKKNYFEFLQEKDLLTLRYLIQVLYDKLEFNGENKGKIEVLEQKIVDSQRNSSMLHDGILEKNIQFNTLSTKFYILLQKAKDFLWLIGETRKELKKLLFEEKNLLNYTRKTSLENLLKEFEILEKKMYEFEKEETKQENIVDESVFLKKLDKTRNQVKETFRSFFTEKPLKENIGILNSNSSLNLKTNERQIEKKNYELFEKELK